MDSKSDRAARVLTAALTVPGARIDFTRALEWMAEKDRKDAMNDHCCPKCKTPWIAGHPGVDTTGAIHVPDSAHCMYLQAANGPSPALIERVARRMKVRSLHAYAEHVGRDVVDDVAIRMNSQPTYQEVQHAKAWVEAVLEELKK